MGICIYIMATTLFLQKLYNAYLVAGLHVLMIIFWIVDLGLVANLARIWSGEGYGVAWCYGCVKRDLSAIEKRDTTYQSYYGVLAAGAFFGAVELYVWRHLNRERGLIFLQRPLGCVTSVCGHLPE